MKRTLLFVLALVAAGCGPPDGPYELYYDNGQLREKGTYVAGELDGPYEDYYENGQLGMRGTYNMGEACGEWFEDGETVTYSPCPPGLADGN
jgi:antitoxin component YwqK of YwqJK toxin-antitoxin module